MSVKLSVVSGAAKGQSFSVKGGESLGRENCDITLKDRKVSGIHAKIEFNKRTKQLFLVDQKSKNGIKLGGKNVKKIPLEIGLEFQIGDHVFKVEKEDHPDLSNEIKERMDLDTGPISSQRVKKIEFSEKSKPEGDSKPEVKIRIRPKKEAKPKLDTEDETKDIPDSSTATIEVVPNEIADTDEVATKVAITGSMPQRKMPKTEVQVRQVKKTAVQPLNQKPSEIADEEKNKKVSWREVLESACIDRAKELEDQPRHLEPFKPMLRLSFIHGLQSECEYELGYGPRKAGVGELDLPIYDSDIKGCCFEIHPSKDGPVFKTRHPGKVHLNQTRQELAVLKEGDVISFGDNKIKVELLK